MAADSNNGSSAWLAVIMLGVVYSLGYAVAVTKRANSDYKKTKASLPGLRKGFWQAWWHAVKIGMGVLLGVVILVSVFMHEVRN